MAPLARAAWINRGDDHRPSWQRALPAPEPKPQLVAGLRRKDGSSLVAADGEGVCHERPGPERIGDDPQQIAVAVDEVRPARRGLGIRARLHLEIAGLPDPLLGWKCVVVLHPAP